MVVRVVVLFGVMMASRRRRLFALKEDMISEALEILAPNSWQYHRVTSRVFISVGQHIRSLLIAVTHIADCSIKSRCATQLSSV